MVLSFLLAAPIRYVPYGNARFGFSLDRPAFLAPGRPPDNGDGQEFRSGAIVMRAYAGWNVEDMTAASALKERARGLEPAFVVAKSSWYALSWTEKGIVHYEKTFVSHTRHTTVEFEYPLAESSRMGPIVTHVVRSFRP